jgi:hypothetical protein
MVEKGQLYEKFIDSPYYFELELCGGAVMVPPLASDALLTTLHLLLENVNRVIG